MASHIDFNDRQTERDIALAVESFEQWKHLASQYRFRSEEAQATEYKVTFQTLAEFAEAAARSLQSLLETARPLTEAAELARTPTLRPVEPEWRPGAPADSGD